MIYIVSPFENELEGRGTRNVALANKFSSDQKVMLITSNFSHQLKINRTKDDILKRITGKYDITVLTVPPYKKNLSLLRFITHWVFAFKLCFFLLLNSNSSDKVLVSSIPPEVLFLLSLTKVIVRFKVVLDVRDIWPDAFPIKKSIIYKFFSLYCGILLFLSRKLPNSITYVAPSFQNWIQRYFNNIPSVFVPLGYDASRWNINTSYCKFNSDNKIHLVYVGYLESQFPLDSIIQLVAASDSLILHVVGDGSYKTHYSNISNNNIIFYGSLPASEASEIVFKSDIGVLPIKHGAQMPNKLFDYIGAGLPILAVGKSDSSEFVINHNIGWFCCFDDVVSVSNVDFCDINKKKLNIELIRCKFSKDCLYSGFDDMFNGGLND